MASEKQNEAAGDVMAADEDVMDDAHSCGYFSWRPKCVQSFAKPPWLLICLMGLAFSQGKEKSGQNFVHHVWFCCHVIVEEESKRKRKLLFIKNSLYIIKIFGTNTTFSIVKENIDLNSQKES